MYEQLIKGRWMAKQVHRQLQSASSDSASQLSKSPGTGIWATQILDHSICGSAVRETVAGLAPRIGQTRTDGMTTGTAQKDRQAGLFASHSSDSPLQIVKDWTEAVLPAKPEAYLGICSGQGAQTWGSALQALPPAQAGLQCQMDPTRCQGMTPASARRAPPRVVIRRRLLAGEDPGPRCQTQISLPDTDPRVSLSRATQSGDQTVTARQ